MSNPLIALEAFLASHPSISYISPSSPDFAAAREVWNRARRDHPLAVVQPQSPADVGLLVNFAKSQSLPFTFRVGGHNTEGRSVVENALLIDLRALKSITVAPDRQSATVQGGILQGELANALWTEGLATPTGALPSVGYAGWAMYGGYGPFSSHWGLGVDQILGATVMNADGIRGAGGLFGAVIDLTIKVYPLTNLLAGSIIYDSTDIAKTFMDFNAAYDQLLHSEDLPPQLTLQQVAFNGPPGRVFAVSFTWSGEDTKQGQRWSARIAGFAPSIMNTVSITTIPDWLGGNGAHIPHEVSGSAFSHSLARLPSTVTETIGHHLARLPADPGAMFSIHQLRGPSATPQSHSSVFVARQPHYMLEILGFATDEKVQERSERWALDMAIDVKQVGSEYMLPTSYVSLYNTNQATSAAEAVDNVYGSKVEVLRDLKVKFDPENVFGLAIPALK
ncbi:hypothetical protein N7492_004177 [Penicillium capsulatum]|uniref:FAD-binding PCMH-type domain-containing protein n=1 Tax=Penicillium capsulatum TaxID=69766 RepID=A0A9W9LY48_9EURO|nr:hypothetical protein N7492_004177 [Penicillium capsulatum]KAJ6121253.1 hypothetical protein N7512_003718 [Penicillium capsulatum]